MGRDKGEEKSNKKDKIYGFKVIGKMMKELVNRSKKYDLIFIYR